MVSSTMAKVVGLLSMVMVIQAAYECNSNHNSPNNIITGMNVGSIHTSIVL